ncbi:MAG TPA: hypothetical protein VFQ53_10600 [Kofleriaceae bacterium]|nr:hypothetical protein [Kofleriaceae bacterium]
MKVLIAACVLALCAHTAAADSKADTLFKKGKKLLAEKKYAEACATFEKADQAEPAIGAKLNVAKCYEEWGKLARAWRWYSDAEKMATDTADKRAPKIKELIDTLDADVPRLTVKLPDGIDPAVAIVKLDGKRIAPDQIGKEQRVDPGTHALEYTATTGKKTKNVPLEKGGSTELTLDVAKPAPDTKVTPDKPDTTRPDTTTPPDLTTPKPVSAGDPGRTRRLAGIAVASAGGLALGIAGYLTLDARSTYKDALSAHCMNQTDMCDDEGVQITKSARSRANTATAISIIGALAVAGGVVLYVTAPKAGPDHTEHALYLSPSLHEHGGGIVLGGGF